MKKWIHDRIPADISRTVEDNGFEDDTNFYGVPLKEMKFYYNDKIDPDVYPTFMHWMDYLKKNDLWYPPEDER